MYVNVATSPFLATQLLLPNNDLEVFDAYVWFLFDAYAFNT